MITQDEILLHLYRDAWFEPSESYELTEIQDESGNTISVPKSYYHHYENLGDIVVRVSEHGTFLKTWIEHEPDVNLNLQNLSVVFSNGPVETNLKTLPQKAVDSEGKVITRYTYFVVEQYVYRLDNLSYNDFLKVINQVKRLSADKVFSDPLMKKPDKKANRTVLEPDDEDGKPIPQNTNPIHPRQKAVASNKDFEVDEKGNIIKELKSNKYMKKTINEAQLRDIVKESVRRILKETIDFSHGYANDSCPMVGYDGFYDEGKGPSVNSYVGRDVLGICQRIEYLCKKHGYENPEITAREDDEDYYMNPGQNFGNYYDNPHRPRSERNITIEICLNPNWMDKEYNRSKQESELANKIHKMLALSGRLYPQSLSVKCSAGHISLEFTLSESFYNGGNIQVGDVYRDSAKYLANLYGNVAARQRRLKKIPSRIRGEYNLDV